MDERDALETALTAHFAAQRLHASRLRYAYASALPAAALWFHAWHPLPDLAVWFAALGWAALLTLALSLTAASYWWRSRLTESLPDAQRVVRVYFAGGGDPLTLSSVWFAVSLAASGVLWLHAVVPAIVSAAATGVAVRTWVLFLVAALVNRALELG